MFSKPWRVCRRRAKCWLCGPLPHSSSAIEALLAKNRNGGLSEAEQLEWQQYQYLEHLVRIAKAQATLKLAGKSLP